MCLSHMFLYPYFLVVIKFRITPPSMFIEGHEIRFQFWHADLFFILIYFMRLNESECSMREDVLLSKADYSSKG